MTTQSAPLTKIRAGLYETPGGRFWVEQRTDLGYSRPMWLVTDNEAMAPYCGEYFTLAEAKVALADSV